MKRLYATTDPIEAELLRALLRDAGIESFLDNQNSADYAVGLPTSAVSLGINVGDADAAGAVDVLARHFEHQDAVGMEPDPDAPPPMTQEESDRFARQVRRGAPRRRFWLAFFTLLPLAVGAGVMASLGNWRAAAIIGGPVLGLVALGWFLNLLTERRDPGDGPAP